MTPAALCAAPALATALLLLAAHRAWLCRRAWVEGVALVVALTALASVLAPLPAVIARALAPFAVLTAFWFSTALAAWRFAPDSGQSGLGWTATAALAPTAAAGFALAFAHAGLAFVPLPPLFNFTFLGAVAFFTRRLLHEK